MNRPALTQPLALPAAVAGGLALLGLVFGMLSLGIGWLPLGVTGVVLMGLAAGLVGGLRHRLLIAVGLWVFATALTGASAALGSAGFTLIGPVLLTLIVFATGQFTGLLAGVLVRRRSGHEPR